MAKKKLNTLGNNMARGPIARKVISVTKMKLQEKVAYLADWKSGMQNAKELQKTVISDDQLAQYDPLHAAYIYGQNQLSVLIEHIINLPMVHKLADAYVDAYDEYTPSYPPMSPLTDSYFTCWASFDLSSNGSRKETLATISIDVSKTLKANDRLIALYETLQASRMGIYVHEGVSGKYLFLRELITGQRVKAICASGYLGHAGEIWFVRVLPPLEDLPKIDYSVVFTTPYLLGKSSKNNQFISADEQDWLDYFERNLAKIKVESKELAYEHLMKYGFNSNYWNEYVFLAYRNYRDDVIFLDGIPDIPLSLPHSELARDTFYSSRVRL